MISGRKAYVFVIALGREIRRIAIKKAHLAVLCRDEFLEILIFNYNLLKPPRSLFNKRKVAPHTVRFSAKTITPACVRISYQLIKLRRALHIADFRFFGNYVFYAIKVLAAVKHKPQLFD